MKFNVKLARFFVEIVLTKNLSIKQDKLRLTVTVSAKVKSDYFFVLEKGSAMEEKWIIKDANDNRAYNSDKCC